MVDDDPWDDMHGVSTMALTSAARVAETLLRSAQDRVRREADRDEQQAEQADRRYEAQAKVADEYYQRAATPEFVREQSPETMQTTWDGLREWEQIDPERFSPHTQPMAEAIVAVHGGAVDEVDATLETERLREAEVAHEDEADLEHVADLNDDQEVDLDNDIEYDSDEARSRRDQQLDSSHLEPEVKTAIKIADRQNGHDPAEAAAAGATSESDGRGTGQRGRGRGRARARTRQSGRSR